MSKFVILGGRGCEERLQAIGLDPCLEVWFGVSRLPVGNSTT